MRISAEPRNNRAFDHIVQINRSCIRQGQFVTLLGPGDIDKTTVAVAAGHGAHMD
jgi:hypothetical protein